MDNDCIKETISNLKAVRNNFWTAILLTTGASITLALNADNIFKYLLVIIGIIISAGFIAIYRSINSDINLHIDELKNEKR